MMGSPHYSPTGFPRTNQTAVSEKMRAEFRAIEDSIAEMDCHSISVWLQPWLANLGDFYVAVPFACKMVAGSTALLGNAPDTASYNLFNGVNQIATTTDNGIVEEIEWNSGPWCALATTGDTPGSTFFVPFDLDDTDNDLSAGQAVRIRTVAFGGYPDSTQSILTLRLLRTG